MNQQQPVSTMVREKKRRRPKYTVTYTKFRVTHTELADLCEALSQFGDNFKQHQQIKIECHPIWD